jgi:bacterioferritin-associated ferredoxin
LTARGPSLYRSRARHAVNQPNAMLVCQCNIISDAEVRAVVRALLDEDPWAIVVPAHVYRALAMRCKCAGCVPNVVDIITEVTEEYRLRLADSPTANVAPQRRNLNQVNRRRGRHERRFAGHRTAE